MYRVPRRGGEQPECERAACSKANPFRRGVAASLLGSYGEAWNRKEPIVCTGVDRNVTYKRATWLGVGCSEGKTDGPERPVALARCGRIQSPHSTAAAL
jgi:hypothetical protein